MITTLSKCPTAPIIGLSMSKREGLIYLARKGDQIMITRDKSEICKVQDLGFDLIRIYYRGKIVYKPGEINTYCCSVESGNYAVMER